MSTAAAIQAPMPHFSQRRDWLVALPGSRFAYVSGNTLQSRHVEAVTTTVAPLPGPVRQLATDGHGGLFLLGDGVVWRASPSLDTFEEAVLCPGASRIAVESGGDRLALAHLEDNEVRVLDLVSGELLATYPGPDSTHQLHALTFQRNRLWWAGHRKLVWAEGTETGEVALPDVPGISTLRVVGTEVMVGDFSGGRILWVERDGQSGVRLGPVDGNLYDLAVDENNLAWVVTPRTPSGPIRLFGEGLDQALSFAPDGLVFTGNTLVALVGEEIVLHHP